MALVPRLPLPSQGAWPLSGRGGALAAAPTAAPHHPRTPPHPRCAACSRAWPAGGAAPATPTPASSVPAAGNAASAAPAAAQAASPRPARPPRPIAPRPRPVQRPPPPLTDPPAAPAHGGTPSAALQAPAASPPRPVAGQQRPPAAATQPPGVSSQLAPQAAAPAAETSRAAGSPPSSTPPPSTPAAQTRTAAAPAAAVATPVAAPAADPAAAPTAEAAAAGAAAAAAAAAPIAQPPPQRGAGAVPPGAPPKATQPLKGATAAKVGAAGAARPRTAAPSAAASAAMRDRMASAGQAAEAAMADKTLARRRRLQAVAAGAAGARGAAPSGQASAADRVSPPPAALPVIEVDVRSTKGRRAGGGRGGGGGAAGSGESSRSLAARGPWMAAAVTPSACSRQPRAPAASAVGAPTTSLGVSAAAVPSAAAVKGGASAAAGRGGGGATKGPAPSSPGPVPELKLGRDGVWTLEGLDEAGLARLTRELQARLEAAVDAEQRYEEELQARLYARTSLARLQEDGRVLAGLTASPHDMLYSHAIWRFSPPTRGELPHHRFRAGDTVLVTEFVTATATSRVARREGLEGIVLEAKRDALLVSLDKGDSDALQAALAASAGAPRWRIDQSVLDTTARRQLEAIRKLDILVDIPSLRGFELLVRTVLLGHPHASTLAEVAPLWVRDSAWRDAVRAELATQTGLNSSQKRAITTALVRSVTLWQGPPGTGKTRTLLALAEVVVRASIASDAWGQVGPVLACAGTNAAVDNLVEGLAARGVSVVRMGQPAKVRESLRHLTLEAQADATGAGQRAVALRRSSQALFQEARRRAEAAGPSGGAAAGAAARDPSDLAAQRRRQGVAQHTSFVEQRARAEWAQAEQLSKVAQNEVLARAQVVAATCAGSGDPLLTGRVFRLVMVDEATQDTEPSALVALGRGAHCVVLAGDPLQLPPTIQSREALRYCLDVTLFERLAAGGLPPLLLDTQYRMAPGIAEFASAWFYGGRLRDGVSAADKPPAAGLAWPRAGVPVAVVAVEGREERSAALGGEQAASRVTSADSAEVSYRNLDEARVALRALLALTSAGDVRSAALLTPYRAQARALEHALRVLAPALAHTPLARVEVSVSSVDGYQGREADVVVFSAVRCNTRGAIGFVADRRRLNVAITRPRRGLVVVCSPGTLVTGSQDWEAFVAWAAHTGVNMDAARLPLAPLDAQDPFALSS